jgi:L,D-transpeptidase ErfK/SrfK
MSMDSSDSPTLVLKKCKQVDGIDALDAANVKILARCMAALLFALLAIEGRGFAQPRRFPAMSDRIVGSKFDYTVRRGDFLILIGARFGESWQLIASSNGLKPEAPIRPGQVLEIDNRHIVPAGARDGIVVNIPQRMLFLRRNGATLGAWPVGAGRPSWPSPQGAFTVTELKRNKTWVVPKSIQAEMEREGQEVRTEVPPGPDNPLGEWWIGMSISGCGIHGTIVPSSVYSFRSHGCIRLNSEDAAKLFATVKVGTPGVLIYEPVLVAWLEDGRVFIEVNRDVYSKTVKPLDFLSEAINQARLKGFVDWARVEEIAKRHDGIAHEVGLKREKDGN